MGIEASLGGLLGALTPVLILVVLLLIIYRKSKNRVLKLKKGEAKRNPGVATVLSFLLCGLGQIYNGQILKGILYMLFYGILVSNVVRGFSTGYYEGLLVLALLPLTIWILGMVDANGVARKINVQLDCLMQTTDTQFRGTDPGKEAASLCLSCWLSGDCKREQQAVKKREVMTNGRG